MFRLSLLLVAVVTALVGAIPEDVLEFTVRRRDSPTSEKFFIQLHKNWAPNGYDRIMELVKVGFFNDIRMFRTIDGFMSQFGLSGSREANLAWRSNNIPYPDKVVASNTRGIVTFAMDGAKKRTTQLFINYADNSFLDQQGFAPVGEVLGDGMAIVERFYKGYGESPNQGIIVQEGNHYLDDNFPLLTLLETVRVVGPEESMGDLVSAGGHPPKHGYTGPSAAAFIFVLLMFCIFRSRRQIIGKLAGDKNVLPTSMQQARVRYDDVSL